MLTASLREMVFISVPNARSNAFWGLWHSRNRAVIEIHAGFAQRLVCDREKLHVNNVSLGSRLHLYAATANYREHCGVLREDIRLKHRDLALFRLRTVLRTKI